jgi:hypothetical protein
MGPEALTYGMSTAVGRRVRLPIPQGCLCAPARDVVDRREQPIHGNHFRGARRAQAGTAGAGPHTQNNTEGASPTPRTTRKEPAARARSAIRACQSLGCLPRGHLDRFVVRPATWTSQGLTCSTTDSSDVSRRAAVGAAVIKRSCQPHGGIICQTYSSKCDERHRSPKRPPHKREDLFHSDYTDCQS